MFLLGKPFLWAKKDRKGEKLSDAKGYLMVKGIQYAPETLRICGKFFQGRLLGTDNKLFGEWKGFACLTELNSRFGEQNVAMIMRTIQYLPESVWGVRDTPIRLQELEEWFLASLPNGRYERLFVISIVTSNTDVYLDGVRDKVHCRPTAYGMHDINDILELLDGIRDQYGDPPTAVMVRSQTYLSRINQKLLRSRFS